MLYKHVKQHGSDLLAAACIVIVFVLFCYAICWAICLDQDEQERTNTEMRSEAQSWSGR